MLCPAPLLGFLGRVYERKDRCSVQHHYSLFLDGVMRGGIDAVSSTHTRFSWRVYERGSRCCVQHPYSLFLDGL